MYRIYIKALSDILHLFLFIYRIFGLMVSRLVFISLVLLIFPYFSRSQEVVASSGEHFSYTNGSMSFTVGELIVETVSFPNGILTQGFHQLFDTSSGLIENISPPFSVFPNPTIDNFQVNVPPALQIVEVILLDGAGRRVKNLSYPFSPEIEIDISNLSQGCYHLYLTSIEQRTHYLGILTKN